MVDTEKILSVQLAIRMAFGDFYTLAAHNVKSKKGEKRARANVALANIKDMAFHPEHYLSAAATNNMWTEKYQQLVDYDPFFVLKTPANNAAQMAYDALGEELYLKYLTFCNLVQEFEHTHDSLHPVAQYRARVVIDKILAQRQEIHKMVEWQQTSPIVRAVQKIKNSLSK